MQDPVAKRAKAEMLVWLAPQELEAVRDREVPAESKEFKVNKVNKVALDPLVPQDEQDQVETLGQQVTLAAKALQVPKDLEVQGVQQDHKVSGDQAVSKEKKEMRDAKVQTELEVRQVQLEISVNKEMLANLAQMAEQDQQVHEVIKDPLEERENLEIQVDADLQDAKAQEVLKDSKV